MGSASASVLHRDDHSRRSQPGQRVMVSNVHHVGIVVKSLTDAYRFWIDTMGLSMVREALVEDQGVRAALLAAGASSIELLEPTRPDTGIARFLDKRGEASITSAFSRPPSRESSTASGPRTFHCWMPRHARAWRAASRS